MSAFQILKLQMAEHLWACVGSDVFVKADLLNSVKSNIKIA